MKKPHEVLGVNKNASLDEIRRAFRQKALQCHPDLNSAPDAEEVFKAINEAYDALSRRRRMSTRGQSGLSGQTVDDIKQRIDEEAARRKRAREERERREAAEDRVRQEESRRRREAEVMAEAEKSAAQRRMRIWGRTEQNRQEAEARRRQEEDEARKRSARNEQRRLREEERRRHTASLHRTAEEESERQRRWEIAEERRKSEAGQRREAVEKRRTTSDAQRQRREANAQKRQGIADTELQQRVATARQRGNNEAERRLQSLRTTVERLENSRLLPVRANDWVKWSTNAAPEHWRDLKAHVPYPDPGLAAQIAVKNAELLKSRAEWRQEMDQVCLREGQRVNHDIHGLGAVQAITETFGTLLVWVVFDTGRRHNVVATALKAVAEANPYDKQVAA